MTWPGGKNGAGVYQRIINHMPPHRAYIELFLGSGAILRHKRPAELNIGIDKSQKALDLCNSLIRTTSHNIFYRRCGIDHLARSELLPNTLLYCDPPYVKSTRKGGDLYEHEMSLEDHDRLLSLLVRTKAMVMISGYRSDFYDDALKDFHRIDYKTMTRGGLVDESLWMNFSPPAQLHDYSFLGADYRERERIKRKKARWKTKITNMDRLERLAIMEVLESV